MSTRYRPIPTTPHEISLAIREGKRHSQELDALVDRYGLAFVVEQLATIAAGTAKLLRSTRKEYAVERAKSWENDAAKLGRLKIQN